MVFESLIRCFPDTQVTVYSVSAAGSQISGIRVLTDRCGIQEADVLYICCQEHIPDTLPENDAVYSLLVLGDPSRFSRETGTKRFNLAFLSGCDDPLEACNFLFSDLLCQMEKGLPKDRLYASRRNNMRSCFLNDMLNIKNPPQEMIAQRLRQLSVEMKDKLYVAVFYSTDDSGRDTAGNAEAVLGQLFPVLTDSLYLIRDGELIILFNFSKEKKLHGYLNQLLRAQAASYRFHVGISNAFQNLAQIQKYYGQAKCAAEICARYGCYDVAYFELAAPVELLHKACEQAELLDFCVPGLLALQKMDREHASEYMPTLFYYLETFGDAGRTAKLVHIHKNTLSYRLSKIRQILGCDFSRGEDVFRLMLSLRILRMLGIFQLPGNVPALNIDDLSHS